jgi:signal transduction histidine kinase
VAGKVVFTVVVGYTIISTYFTISSYYSYLSEAENETLLRLQGIANSTSLQINGDEQELLITKYKLKDDIQSSSQESLYYKIHTLLKRTQEANMLKTAIYTMTYDSARRNFVFLVSSSETPYYRHSYHSYPKILISQYQSGGQIKRYSDENGEWLSSFSPIKNSRDKVIALVQVDQKFDEFIADARRTVFKTLFISLLLISVILVILIRLLRVILDKEAKDRSIIEDSYHTNAIISKKLEESLNQLKEINKLRKEMIANISHDLRTPLATINGFIETLYLKRKEIASDDSERYFRIVLKESGRLSKLISELFDLSKLEANQIQIKTVPFSIAELIQDVSQKYQILCHEKNIVFDVHLTSSIPYVLADIQLIDRALQNLVDNAIKYNCNHGRIEITAQKMEDFVEVKISNTGPGISKEEINQIFDRYYKNAKSNSESSSTGLGLAIVNKIIELHNSTIYAESELNKYTSFSFKLPVYKSLPQ